jgi:hypothetical protein
LPVNFGLLSYFIPTLVEREIDEEDDGVSVDKNPIWLKIRALGFGWARFTMTVPTLCPAAGNFSPSFFGAYLGVYMKGTLIFTNPVILKLDDDDDK